MITNELDGYIKKYIEGYLFADLNSIKNDIPSNKHPGNDAYLLLLSTLSAMEFIGLLMRSKSPVKDDRVDASHGLGSYIKHRLMKIDTRYAILAEIAPRLIRNGIAHTYATKGRIAITRMGERDQSHLVVYGKERMLVLNANYLLEDFIQSYEQEVKPHLNPESDLYQTIVNNYEDIREVYKREVDQTMLDADEHLAQLEWLHDDIEGKDIEELEINGTFVLVS